ncbi:hypothetical protein [Novispirillum itersonii]|uniref:hypothetical protein n=1 Tax=Novispirillum itersonii TaxID=189 RepID=UPI00036062D6|nr:hypothetical protein [Novispirillum itersonii]
MVMPRKDGKNWVCRDCGTAFNPTPLLLRLLGLSHLPPPSDTRCPRCGSTQVWPLMF